MAMALRSLSRRLSVARGSSPFSVATPRRGLSDAPKTGGVLSEEEKAGENIFVKKLEKEKLEKMARQAEKDGKHVEGSGSGSGSSSSGSEWGQSEQPPADKSKNIAIAAAVIALVAGGWWYARSGSKAKEEEKH